MAEYAALATLVKTKVCPAERVLVLLAEIDGLVGVSLTRSPGLIDGTTSPAEWPQIRDWLSFCGERVHTGAQALVTGFVSAADDPALVRALIFEAACQYHVRAAAEIAEAAEIADAIENGDLDEAAVEVTRLEVEDG